MATEYTQAKDGEWFPAVKTGWKHACCDCGLVHTVTIRQDGDLLRMMWNRDPRATGGMRAAMKRKLEGIWRHGRSKR